MLCGFIIFRMEMSQDFHSTSKHSVSGFRLTRQELTTYAVISFIVVLWCNYKWSRRHFEKLASKMTGPPAYPIIGAGLEFVGTPQRKEKRKITDVTKCNKYLDNILLFFKFRGHGKNDSIVRDLWC